MKLTISPDMEQILKTRRQKFGFTYGAAAGLAFAIALWAYDGYLLSTSHALFPWLKLTTGAILTTLTGGLAGWLTARFEKTLLGLVFWAGSSGMFGLFTVLVPLFFAPKLTGLFEPQVRSLLQYTLYDNLPYMVGVAFGWVIVSSIIIAVIQIPMIDQAVFSITGFGKVKPHILCAVLMLISGSVADSLNNKPLRDPILGLDTTIQFALDMRGKEIDPKVSREMHLASLRLVEDSIQESRTLVISRYDPLLENVFVLVNSEGHLAECSTFVGIPVNCKSIVP
jgi:hypothetical protein